MAKRHWYTGLSGACKVPRSLLGWWYELSPSAFLDHYAVAPDRICTDCAKAARLALAAESAPKRTSRCAVPGCGSYAINPGQHGRIEGADLDLCDVCYWRKRAFDPRPMSEAREDEILGYCPGIGWRRLSRVAWRRWGLTGAEHIANYEPTHFLPLPPEVM